MTQHLVILTSLAAGGWRVHIPDYPGCRAEAATADSAIAAAVALADERVRRMRREGKVPPPTRDLESIRADETWSQDRAIDWASTTVSVVQIPEQRAPRVLAADLDGTLLRTDLAYETFWSAFCLRWTTPIEALLQLGSGRAHLKRRLAERSSVDVTQLPYNSDVIGYIRAWREAGGRTVLVTAADQTLADRVAAHLGLFDEVYGSDGVVNLKAERKAEFLVERYGENGFSYIGDATADLAVWKHAEKAIIVSPTKSLERRVSALVRNVEHLVSQPPSARSYIKALRPHQWLKNMLVFLPMLTAHQLTIETFAQSVLAFISFSLVASSVYLLNDLLDLAADRAHPRKRLRPLASGAIPIAHGTWLVPLLFAAGLSFAIALNLNFVLVMLGYYAATTAYSVYLKRRVIIDICVLAGLYTLRLVAGGAATGIPLSEWLLAFSIFFFFSLAAVKRQAELVDGVASGKITAYGRGYRTSDVSLNETMATASGYVSVLVMALYVNSPTVQELYHRPHALLGICLVLLYWISRMVMIAHRGLMHDDPIVFAVKDRISLICFALILIFALSGMLL